MATKILIIGAKGMLGTALASVFSDLNPICWDKDDIDITDEQKVENKILELRPEVIINAAAYTNVDGCEQDQDIAMLVNGIAVGYLANAAKMVGAILVHYSTDYIFDGEKKQGYNEDDVSGPLNFYGKSKLRGEEELKKNISNYYLIRSSWLYGPSGKNFVDTILKLVKDNGQVNVVNDQFGRPTYTFDLAKATKDLILSKKSFGNYHLVNQTDEGGVTWYQLAKKVIELAGVGGNVNPCTTKEFVRPAIRPTYSALNDNKFIKLPDWQNALERYLNNKK